MPDGPVGPTSPGSRPAALHLVLGDEELLVERVVQDLVVAARAVEPDAELRRVRTTDLASRDLTELLSPSLFADARVLVLLAAQEAGKEIAATITGYAADPVDGIVLVVQHAGGARGKALADALRRDGAQLHRCEQLRWPEQRADFLRAEVRRLGGRIDAGATTALLEATRPDLREIAAAASQLVADTGGRIDERAVGRYYRGRAEVTGFAVADLVVAGDRAAALEALRWALLTGTAPVLVADALAGAFRALARVGSAGRGDPAQLAGELGMPSGRVKRVQAQVRSWHPDAVAAAFEVTAQVNADVKGLAPDAGYALEHAVQRICDIRSAPR